MHYEIHVALLNKYQCDQIKENEMEWDIGK